MGQKERVLDYLERLGSITSLDAFRDLGVTRLSAIIYRLRDDGYQIKTKDEFATNRFGERTHYARYEFQRETNEEDSKKWQTWQS